MDEPRTHYQISLTARQAVGLFVGLLLSLGLAFFFGLMTGLSGREKASAGPVRTPAQAVPAAAAPTRPRFQQIRPRRANEQQWCVDGEIDEVLEHTYLVVFSARDLFGDRAELTQQLSLDLWESYLEPLEA